MITDAMPKRPAALRRQFEQSDAQATLPLPDRRELVTNAKVFEAALATADEALVCAAGSALLAPLADFYKVKPPALQVLGARPLEILEDNWSYELFGDYTPKSQRMRIWMRTAVHKRVTSYRGLLNTLLHEFCHHLDVTALGYPDTFHTRGFFGRVDELYHLALETPPDKRKPLVWVKSGRDQFRIDWTRVRSI